MDSVITFIIILIEVVFNSFLVWSFLFVGALYLCTKYYLLVIYHVSPSHVCVTRVKRGKGREEGGEGGVGNLIPGD